jgi:uncharacterized protein
MRTLSARAAPSARAGVENVVHVKLAQVKVVGAVGDDGFSFALVGVSAVVGDASVDALREDPVGLVGSCLRSCAPAEHARQPAIHRQAAAGGEPPLAPGRADTRLIQTMFFDPVYLAFLLPGILLSLWASWNTKATFRKYSQVGSRRGWSGAEAARELIKLRGASGVHVEETPGFLSDHYDPGARVLRLSPDVYHGRSLAALGVAAHEAGHAIQHAKGYGPLKFRSWMVKPAMIGSNLSTIVLTVGFMSQMTGLVWIGIILFSAFVVFTLVTLPVEFDASNRAVAALQETGMIDLDEAPGAKAVLRAAAMTYVAAAIAAILQLLYFLMRAGLLGGRRDD